MLESRSWLASALVASGMPVMCSTVLMTRGPGGFSRNGEKVPQGVAIHPAILRIQVCLDLIPLSVTHQVGGFGRDGVQAAHKPTQPGHLMGQVTLPGSAREHDEQLWFLLSRPDCAAPPPIVPWRVLERHHRPQTRPYALLGGRHRLGHGLGG